MVLVIKDIDQVTEERVEIDLPESLICDVIDGKVYPFAGWEKVINGEKSIEDIMGSSSLQGNLISIMLKALFVGIDERKYRILTSEMGYHQSLRNNFSIDIGIYDRGTLSYKDLSEKYTDKAPKVAIEVDTKIDLSDTSEMEYVTRKTQKLLECGVEKVAWIFTKTQTCILATPEDAWRILDWNNDLELLPEYSLNIADLIERDRQLG